MNKMLDRYGERHGFRKEWEAGPYMPWLERFFEPFGGMLEVGSKMPLTRDARVRGACVEMAVLAFIAAFGTSLAVWVVLRLAEKALHHLRRPSYYAGERERRVRLQNERRKIRRRTTRNPCPTPEALERQFAHAKDSPAEMIRFGSMLEDLECFVDNSLAFDDAGNIIGRQRGIRGWLQEHCLALWARYKTVMRYKAMAKKFRQVAAVRDPVPAAALLDANPPPELRASAKIAGEFLAACANTQVDVLWQLERRLNPDWVVFTGGEGISSGSGGGNSRSDCLAESAG